MMLDEMLGIASGNNVNCGDVRVAGSRTKSETFAEKYAPLHSRGGSQRQHLIHALPAALQELHRLSFKAPQLQVRSIEPSCDRFLSQPMFPFGIPFRWS